MSGNLSTLEIAQLRGDQGDYFPDTATLQTVARTSDNQGGFTEVWSNTYTSVACRVSPIRASLVETLEGDQISAASRWILSVAHNQAISEDMRVVHDSETYEIEHLEDTHSNRTARRAYLMRLD